MRNGVALTNQPELAAAPSLTLWLEDDAPPLHARVHSTFWDPWYAQQIVILTWDGPPTGYHWAEGAEVMRFPTLAAWREQRRQERAYHAQMERLVP